MSQKLTSCTVCNGNDFSAYCEGVIRCGGCRLVVAEDIPTSEEVSDLYQKDYFFGKEYFDYEADRPALEYNFKHRIRSMRHMIQPGFDIVEIGCAYGYFLNLAKDKVKSHIGFDVSKEGVDFARKQLSVNATNGDFTKYKFKERSIDSVFMWDVAEHLTHPDEYFEKVAKVLKKGGRLALTTGNVEALLPRLRKGNWRMIHPPTHVYYFSPATITKMLENHGLTVERIRHRGVSRNVGSVFNQVISNSKARNKNTTILEVVHRLAEKTKLNRLNIPLNTFDIMEVTAVKS